MRDMLTFMIYFIVISLSDERLCISPRESFNLSSLSFDLIEIENKILSLNPININRSQCHIEIKSNWNENKFEILFNCDRVNIYSSRMNNVEYETRFVLDVEPFSIVSLLIYNCSTENVCERNFLLNRLSILFEQNYNQLKSELIKIFFDNEDQLNKQIKDLIQYERYFDKYCATIIKIGPIVGEISHAVCDEKKTKSTSIKILVKSNKLKPNLLEYNIEYICLFYGCHYSQMMKNLTNIIEQFYNVSSIIYGINLTRTTQYIKTTINNNNNNNSTAYHFEIEFNLIFISILFLFI